MKYRNIMVHVDTSAQSWRRVELAVKIAKEHGAFLTALYVVTHQYYKPEHEGLKERIAETEKSFRELTAGMEADWIMADWQVAGIGMVEIINYYAHSQDLVIVGQTPPDQAARCHPHDLPERVVLGAGRPVLVVPYVGSFATMGKKIIVSWKTGRSSARALNDAMPFLLVADEVCLLEIRHPDEQVVAAISPKDDVAENLRRHGIKVRDERLVTGSITVANILMNYAWENGCDMIVMGAYSSSSRGTLNLGAVADQMLDLMTLPVLMAH